VALVLAAGSVLRPLFSTSAEDLKSELTGYGHRIVHETCREGNWELYAVSADGSDSANLTRTPEVNEIFPHVSPDGAAVAFLVDKGKGESLVRSAWHMDFDGTDCRRIGENIRWSCWNREGSRIVYTKGESDQFSYSDATSTGLFFYDPSTGRHRRHPNEAIHHVYNMCASPDGNWFVATVHAGMGYSHTNVAIEADGGEVVDLGFGGCRPDISPDGKRIAWGESDWVLCVADLDLRGRRPKVSGVRPVVTSSKPMMVYHVDWSPDGKYVAFTRGPHGKRMGRSPAYLGIEGKGWDICVADASREDRWVAVTTDGLSNKEPDWAPGRRGRL